MAAVYALHHDYGAVQKLRPERTDNGGDWLMPTQKSDDRKGAKQAKPARRLPKASSPSPAGRSGSAAYVRPPRPAARAARPGR